MCSAKKATQAVRAAAGVMTFGGTEALRANKGTRNIVEKAESTVNKAFGGSGQTASGLMPYDRTSPIDTALSLPPPPPAPDPIPTEGPGPSPTFMPPNPSETAAMRRRRKLNAMRMGITSTVLTSGTGVGAGGALLTPVAGPGPELKKVLGA